jgi:DNA-binding CsgD family transcriptional regulator
MNIDGGNAMRYAMHMTYTPNYFMEAVCWGTRFAALFIVFYMLYRPETKARRIALILVMALQYPFCRLAYFLSGKSFAFSVICDIVIFAACALVCGTEEGESNEKSKNGNKYTGRLSQASISAVYLYVILQFIYYIISCYALFFTKQRIPSFSFLSYTLIILENLILVLWALAYYHLARKMTAGVPLRFWLITVLTPLLGIAVLIITETMTKSLVGETEPIFLCGALFGTILLLFDAVIFYFYVNLSVVCEARLLAEQVADTPPVYTTETGLSDAFVRKYDITGREREVIERVLHGASNKDIARGLNITVNTTEVHLRHIYQKTGAPGRYALIALIRG